MKKLISVLLSLVMLFALVSVAFAADEVTPVIVVSGMGKPQYEIGEDGTRTKVWGPSTDSIVKAASQFVPALVMAYVNDDFSKIGESVDGIRDIFLPLACDTDGKPLENIEPDLYPLAISEYPEDFDEDATMSEWAVCRAVGDEIGSRYSYFFNYIWSRNPMDIADDLDEYIDGVLEQTGAKKVSLIACSMGGTITMSYLYKYGTARIKNVVLASTAFQGTEIVGQLFNKDVNISIYDALRYFSEFTGYDFLQTVIVLAQKGIMESDKQLLDKADYYIGELVENLKEVAFSDIFLDTFVSMPGIWALMPYSYYEGAKQTLVTDKSKYNFLEKGENSIDVYMSCVQSKAADIISQVRKSGTGVYVVATYFCPGIPVQADASNYTDNLIDVKYASGNATVASYGEALDKTLNTVCADKSHKHLSPDGVVDASTCILPEQTWIIKNVAHMGYEYGTDTCELLVFLSTSESEVNIYSSEKFPQFTEYNSVTKTMSPEFKKSVSKTESSYIKLIFELVKKVIAFLSDIVSAR